MDFFSWVKSMSHLSSMCGYSHLNPQVILYDGHNSHFYDRALNIFQSHHIQKFMLNTGDSLQNNPNYNGKILNLNNYFCDAHIIWMSNHGTLKFTTTHINDVLVKTWEYFNCNMLPSKIVPSIIHTFPPSLHLIKTRTPNIYLQILTFLKDGKRRIYNWQRRP